MKRTTVTTYEVGDELPVNHIHDLPEGALLSAYCVGARQVRYLLKTEGGLAVSDRYNYRQSDDSGTGWLPSWLTELRKGEWPTLVFLPASSASGFTVQEEDSPIAS